MRQTVLTQHRLHSAASEEGVRNSEVMATYIKLPMLTVMNDMSCLIYPA